MLRLNRYIKLEIHLITCALAWLCVSGPLPAWSNDPITEAAMLMQQRKPVARKNTSVVEWFRKYDQIRRNAEITSKDKYQSLFLGESKPDKKNAALASRMIDKYTVALAAMKQLRQVPETRELQKGYIEYFGSARQLFTEFLKGQKMVPYSVKRLAPAKSKLEALDKRNKKIDAQLRKKYGIPKHKHI